MALDDAQDKIKFLENALAAAEAASVSKQAETLANGASAARVEFQENNSIWPPARTRGSNRPLLKRTSLSARCGRASNFCRPHCRPPKPSARGLAPRSAACANSGTRNRKPSTDVSKRCRYAPSPPRNCSPKQRAVAGAIVKNGAFRQKVADTKADAKAANDKAYAKTRQLEDAVTLRQHQIDELERSRATLVEATTTLLETFENRDRALQRAQQKIKALAERNAELEAKANRGARICGTESKDRTGWKGTQGERHHCRPFLRRCGPDDAHGLVRAGAPVDRFRRTQAPIAGARSTALDDAVGQHGDVLIAIAESE